MIQQTNMMKFFLELDQKFKQLKVEKNYGRIGVNTDNDLPLNKQLKFPTLTIIIRRVFQEGEKLYPEIYLDKCLY